MLNSDQKSETSINSGKQGKGEKIIREAKKMKPPHSTKFQIRCAQDLNTKRKKILDTYLALPSIQEKKLFKLSRVKKVSPEKT